MVKNKNIIGIIAPRVYSTGGFDPNTRDHIYNELEILLKNHLEKNPSTECICGINSGVEQDFIKICIKNKIPYTLCIQYDLQHFENLQDIDFNIFLNSAKNVVKISKGKYSPQKNISKIKFIINNSNKLILINNVKIPFPFKKFIDSSKEILTIENKQNVHGVFRRGSEAE